MGSMEIFFVAMPDKKTSQYTFDLDVAASASDFGHLSGAYSIVSMCSMGVWKFVYVGMGVCTCKFVYAGTCIGV